MRIVTRARSRDRQAGIGLNHARGQIQCIGAPLCAGMMRACAGKSGVVGGDPGICDRQRAGDWPFGERMEPECRFFLAVRQQQSGIERQPRMIEDGAVSHVPDDDGGVGCERDQVVPIIDPAHRDHRRLVSELHDDFRFKWDSRRRLGDRCGRRGRILPGAPGNQQGGTAAQQQARDAHRDAPWRPARSPRLHWPGEHSTGEASASTGRAARTGN